MKRFVYIGILFLFITCCQKTTYNDDKEFNAKIIEFDLNCSTCILSFPYDSLEIKNLLGESKDYYYQTVNLAKDKYKIGQMIKVKVRPAENSEIPNCITLYPSYNFKNIFVIESK